MFRDDSRQKHLEELTRFAEPTKYEFDPKERQRRYNLLEAETLAVDYCLDGQSAVLMQCVWRFVGRIYRPHPDTGIEHNFGPAISAKQLNRINHRHYDRGIERAPAFLNQDEKDKLASVVGKLESFLERRELGRNDFVLDRVVRALKELRLAQTRAAHATDPREATPLPKTRENCVMFVAIAWHKFTSQPCRVSRNAQVPGALNGTPLVCFVWAALESALPLLTDGEVQRGIELARKVIAADREWAMRLISDES